MNGCLQRLLVAAAFAAVSSFAVAVADDAGDAGRICAMFDSMGAGVACKVNVEDTAVDLVTSDGVDDAAQFCQTMAAMVAPLVQSLSSSWIMRVFTPESGDTPAAACNLK